VRRGAIESTSTSYANRIADAAIPAA